MPYLYLLLMGCRPVMEFAYLALLQLLGSHLPYLVFYGLPGLALLALSPLRVKFLMLSLDRLFRCLLRLCHLSLIDYIVLVYLMISPALLELINSWDWILWFSLGLKLRRTSQDFIYEMEKIFKVMHVSDIAGVEFMAYQLKGVAY